MPKPMFNATRAITVAVPPERIWPWLVQAGLTRAGWYSYDLLEFGDIWMMRKMLLNLRDRAESATWSGTPGGRAGPA